MTVPVATNTTCDVYHNQPTNPPGSPDVAGVPIYLLADWVGGMEHGENRDKSLNYTHVALMDHTVDVRDAFSAGGIVQNIPYLYVPDKTGTPFVVIFVERMMRGTAQDHKRVWLQRAPGVGTGGAIAVNWPTDNL